MLGERLVLSFCRRQTAFLAVLKYMHPGPQAFLRVAMPSVEVQLYLILIQGQGRRKI